MANTITVVCPNCSHKMRASVKHVGRRGRCPQCGHLVPIVGEGQQLSTVSLADADRDEAARPASGTQVNSLLACLIGLGATVILYALVFFPLAKMGFGVGEMMCYRDFMQYVLVFVTCWGLAILALKYFAVQREVRAAGLELELIPLEIGMQITAENVDKFIAHINRLPGSEQNSIMARRVRGALEHFKHRNNVSEVQSYLETQADIDASGVDSGYSLMRVFVWLCPILGFIGTVLGISRAVTGLAGTLPSAPPAATAQAEPGQATPPAPAGNTPAAAPGGPGDNFANRMLTGMKLVTDGLGVAFDTTLVGLITVVILMFPAEWLKKTEYGMLDRVQAFSNESLLRRMAEGEGDIQDPELPDMVRKTLEAAFKEHQRWLTQWQAQVAQLGQVIGGEFESHAVSVSERLAQPEAARLENFKSAVRRVEELFEQISRATVTWNQSTGSGLQTALPVITELHQSLAANTAALGELLGHRTESVQRPDRVNRASDLQPLEDERHPSGPRKRGIFGRLFGGNGG